MNQEQLDSSISSLISNLKKVLCKIGTDKLAEILNELLPKEQQLTKSEFSESDLFSLVSMNLDRMDIDVLTQSIKVKYDQQQQKEVVISEINREKYNCVLQIVCDEIGLSNKFIEIEKFDYKQKTAIAIFCHILKHQLNAPIEEISLFVNRKKVSIYHYFSHVENLSEKFPEEKKALLYLQNSITKIKSQKLC